MAALENQADQESRGSEMSQQSKVEQPKIAQWINAAAFELAKRWPNIGWSSEIAETIAKYAPTPAPEPTALDIDRLNALLGRLKRAVAEREPKQQASCALWTQGADSDGCGSCFMCMEADLNEISELLEEADAELASAPAAAQPAPDVKKLRDLILEHDSEEDSEGNIVIRFNCLEWMEIERALPVAPVSRKKD